MRAGTDSNHGRHTAARPIHPKFNRFLPESEKQRLKAICKAPPPEPQTIPEAYPENIEKTNAFIKKHLAETEPIKSVGSAHQNTPSDTPAAQSSRTLFKISDDLLELNELLDECDDAQQEALISQWLEQLGDERDQKLDNYAGLITEMLARAEARRAEAKRMDSLAESDEARASFLKSRLKDFFETHHLKKVETARYKLTLAQNGGKVPVRLDDVAPEDLPEQYQRVKVTANLDKIREALLAGEELPFAWLGERGSGIRIK